MTRVWTSQELLALRVVLFYTRNSKPYLGNARLDLNKLKYICLLSRKSQSSRELSFSHHVHPSRVYRSSSKQGKAGKRQGNARVVLRQHRNSIGSYENKFSGAEHYVRGPRADSKPCTHLSTSMPNHSGTTPTSRHLHVSSPPPTSKRRAHTLTSNH